MYKRQGIAISSGATTEGVPRVASVEAHHSCICTLHLSSSLQPESLEPFVGSFPTPPPLCLLFDLLAFSPPPPSFPPQPCHGCAACHTV